VGQFHFRPERYLELMHPEVPDYERVQTEVAAAANGVTAEAILDLGVGTGETARRVLDRHRGARLVGIDASEEMLRLRARRRASAGWRRRGSTRGRCGRIATWRCCAPTISATSG
jgi:trans-aconitate methyltransferase